MAIDWSLVKVDWDMPVRAMLEKTRAGTQVAVAGMQQNTAMMQNQTTQRGQNMDNQQAQARLQQQGQQQQQEMDLNNRRMNEGQRQFDIKNSQDQDQQQFENTVKLMSLKMKGDQAMAVLGAKDKQAAWNQYKDMVTKMGMDPAKLGLPISYNQNAQDFLHSEVGQASQGINNFMKSNGISAGDQNSYSASPMDKKMQEAKFSSDLKGLEAGRDKNSEISTAIQKVDLAKQAAEEFNTYSVTGLGPTGVIGRAIANAGSAFSPDQAKAAAAAKTVHDVGTELATMKRKDMFGGANFSDADRDLLMSTSIDVNMPKSAINDNLERYKGFAERSLSEQSFKEAWMRTYGTTDGYQTAWKQYNQDNPIFDPKTRKRNSDPSWDGYLSLGKQILSNPNQQPQGSGYTGGDIYK